MAFENTTPVAFSLRRVWNYAGTPTSGTSGTFAGSAQPGDILSDTTNTKLYVNTNTAASPTWSQIVTAGVAFAGDLDITGDIDLGGEDISVDQGRAIYLDGQDGGEFITSDTANELTINATTTLNLAIGGTDEVAISATAVTLATNNLTLTAGELALGAGNASVVQGAVIYLDAQDGGEYITSDAANELTIRATTTINLAIGSNDEISISSSAVTLATNNLTLTAGDSSVAQGRAIYLDGQQGGEYIVSDAANELTLNATTTLNLAIAGTDELSISATAVTLATNDFTLTAGDIAVAQGAYVYLDGQGGDEYMVSDAVGEITIKATTVLNLAIGSNDEVSVSATAVTLATNDLALTDGDIAVTNSHVVYFDGQDGGEYIYSSGANELDINATTEINLRIGGTTEIALTASNLNINGVDVAVAAGKFITGAPVKELITAKAADTKYLTAAESGVIDASADGIYLYLPTYIGNTGLVYHIKATASFSAGVAVYGYDDTQNIDGANVKTSGAQYDALRVIAFSQGWHILEKIGTWS